MKVTITGWKEGFKKVSLNQFLRRKYGYSIKESKGIVDKILNGEKATLDVDQIDDFEKVATDIGIVYESDSS